MVVRFIDESDFVNKWIGFILRDCSGWELDSTISLELANLLDDISVFKEELKSADSDPSDPNHRDFNFGTGTSAGRKNNSKKQTEEWELLLHKTMKTAKRQF